MGFVTGRAAKLRAGSTSRPDLEWVVFVKDFEIIARLDLIAAEHTDRVAGFEEDDGDHQGAGEVQGVVLSQGKIVRHLRAFHFERGQSPLDGSRQCRGPVAITARALAKRPQLASGPLEG
ncbi:hypothetical protein A9K71_17685 [Mesorhizobium sp. WSM3873]|nr:hypothetical protein A9K71_17685 [Mesorhizobium sp. WSM3873]